MGVFGGGIVVGAIEAAFKLEEVDLILDLFPNAHQAMGLRKLRKAYAGSAIEVMNDSLVRLDIGFDSNGALDTAAILTHIGSGDGKVMRWYDQGLNGFNSQIYADSATTAIGVVARAGVILTAPNGLPTVEPWLPVTSTGMELLSSNGLATKTIMNVADTTQPAGGDPASRIFSNYAGSGATDAADMVMYHFHSSNRIDYLDGGIQVSIANSSPGLVGIFTYRNATTVGVAYDQQAPVTAGGVNATVNNPTMKLFEEGGGSTSETPTGIQEHIMWATDRSAERVAILDNANAYYSMY